MTAAGAICSCAIALAAFPLLVPTAHACVCLCLCACAKQALEPLAVALVERLMAGEMSHPVVNAALLPVVGGVLLVAGDASLTWGGLLFAVASSASVGEMK